jgi:hypothetical protein
MMSHFCVLIVFRFFSVLVFLEGIGKVSVCLRHQSAAPFMRSTLLGGAGWHRADFAETRTLDVQLQLVPLN